MLTTSFGNTFAVKGPTIETVHFLHVRNEGIHIPCIQVGLHHLAFRDGKPRGRTLTVVRSTIDQLKIYKGKLKYHNHLFIIRTRPEKGGLSENVNIPRTTNPR